jgi:hypothetical protein
MALPWPKSFEPAIPASFLVVVRVLATCVPLSMLCPSGLVAVSAEAWTHGECQIGWRGLPADAECETDGAPVPGRAAEAVLAIGIAEAYYVARPRIRAVYLVDAAVEATLVLRLRSPP